MNKQEEVREGMQHLFCQHCKALQKSNHTVVECWYNPLDYDRAFAFCAANEDAIGAILKDQSDRGVVIKVDKELPANPYVTLRDTDPDAKNPPFNGNYCGYREAREDMLKAGYVAVEPLR